MRMKKYEITDIAHPDNPKLHRIRALTDVGTDVHKGDLGGFVETEDNLDQEGFAWIGKDAIACEDSYIGGDAILADSAVARDSAYVGNNAVIADHAVVQDNAIVCGGYISGNQNKKSVKISLNLFALYAVMVCGVVFALPAFAASDPLVVVENLSTFIFSLIRAVGLILLGWGIVQVGLSLQSHDPSQRSQGFLTLAGGLVITFAKEILDLITA